MRVLKDNDYKTFEQLCGLTQNSMKKTMSLFLRKKYKKVVETKDYIYAKGDIPIALVAHMDTVFPTPATEVYYDRQKNVIWSPDGLGADDRAGIFSIIQIIRRGLHPHIILTTDEEKGAQGASKLGELECPFSDLRYLIQLDRRGANDCVFYDCDNPQFIEYVEDFGFVESIGSFSDISMICPSWKIAGVNLSVGYFNEHSVSEILNVGHMLNTIEKVIKMLEVKDIPKFEYIPATYSYHSMWYKWIPKVEDDKHCSCCHKEFLPEELIPVKGLKGTGEYRCIDCISDGVEWCKSCGEAFVIDPSYKTDYCEDCWYEFGKQY